MYGNEGGLISRQCDMRDAWYSQDSDMKLLQSTVFTSVSLCPRTICPTHFGGCLMQGQ
eukprot:m.83661 g.83661  ORF g.83661 m.83661 type:complete len:58 (-) comp25653_c0_seq1:396-569(-)